jgi:hypothetical protein
MISENEDIQYSVVRMSRGDCCDFNCDTRFTHGVEVRITTISKLFGLKIVDKEVEEKIYCPKHREGSLAKKARRKQHERARQEYKRTIKQQNVEQIRKISKNGLVPVYYYYNRSIYRMNCQNYGLEVENFQEGIQIFERADNEHAIILCDKDGGRYAIVYEGSMNGSEFREHNGERKIDSEELKKKYGEDDINRYEYEIVRSNKLSREKAPEPVRKIGKFDDTEFADIDIYDEECFRIEIANCPGCTTSIWNGELYFAGMKVDGEERIVVIHRDCDRVIGEINPMFEGSGEYDVLR